MTKFVRCIQQLLEIGKRGKDLKNTLAKVLCLFFLVVSLSCDSTIKLYVSPHGNDTNSGTKDFPFRTLEKARDYIRSLPVNKKGKIIVNLRQGIYQLENSFELNSVDSGSEFNTIEYRGMEGEEIKIQGGVSIEPKMVLSLDPDELSELEDSIRRNIKKIDLALLELSDYGSIKNVGFLRPYTTSPMELFINNKPGHLARYPNSGGIQMGEIIDTGSMSANGDYSNRGGIFKYSDDRVSKWSEAEDIWISGYFNRGWAEDAVQIKSIDPNNKLIKTAQAHHYGFGRGAEWKKWHAFNVLQELDAEGEYYLDRKAKAIYFYWEKEKPISSVELSLLESPMIVMEDVSNVTLSNIILENSRGIGIYMEGGENNKIDNVVIRNIGGIGICMGKGSRPNHATDENPEDSIEISREAGSIHQHIYANTAFNRNAGKNHLISNSHIYNVGAGGILLGGGDRKTLTKGNNLVKNCRIHDFNRIEKSYRPGIWITGVGNSISNCEIYNAPMMAIWLHGNDHIIEYNDFHHVVMEMHDQGAIYYGRNPAERGNTIRYNYFHDLGSERLSVGVYSDDGACDMEVYGNVFYKAGSMPVLIGGGNDHNYYNNVFIDCVLGIHIDNRKQGWASGSGDKGGNWEFEERLNVVDYSNPPYSEKYPNLSNYWELDEQFKFPINNVVTNNVFYKVPEVYEGDYNWVEWKSNYVLDSAPEFWDDANQTFKLNNGLIEDKSLEGFMPIEFSKIGIQ